MDRSINLIATNVSIHIIKYSSNLEWPNLFMIFSITGLNICFEPVFTYIIKEDSVAYIFGIILFCLFNVLLYCYLDVCKETGNF
jgi:hypothetical protein